MKTHSRRSVLGFAAAAVAAPVLLPAGQAHASGQLTWAQYADNWTMISKAQPSTSYWSYNRDRALVGHQYDDVSVWRSVFRINIAELAGAVIDEAGFSIVLDHTPTSIKTPVELWTTEAVDPEVPVTWNNFAGSWLSLVATVTGSAYTGGGQPDQELIFPGLAAVVQRAVDKQERFVTVGLRASDETNQIQWKKFYGETARLLVSYQR